MKTSTVVLLGGIAAAAYWLTRPKPVVMIQEVLPPPNSGPVVNGLGNLFNSPGKIMRRSAPAVAVRTGATAIPRHVYPRRPQFRTPLFFR